MPARPILALGLTLQLLWCWGGCQAPPASAPDAGARIDATPGDAAIDALRVPDAPDVPIDVSFSSKSSFSLPAPSGLVAGTTLMIHDVDPKTGALRAGDLATVTAGGAITPAAPGGGLSALGWLLLYEVP